jgi:hypothetical protein
VTSKVINISDRHGQTPSHRPLRLFVDAKGCLQIQERNANGAPVREWELDERATDRLLLKLRAQHATVVRERHYAAHPEDRPKPARERAWRTCALTSNNNVGPSGCRRRSGHDGMHRDRAGHEWAAAFPHHRFCAHAPASIVGGRLPPCIRVMEVDVPKSLRALVGPRALLHVDAEGRCTRCKNVVGVTRVAT